MNFRKWLCLVMAVMMALSAAAMAETAGAEDLQAQLDAANERIAQLEAEVEKYRPYYENQIVAEYGEGGIVWLEDAQAQFDQASAMYAQYGIPVDSYADQIKQSILESMVQQGVLDAKSEELGLTEVDEQTLADLTEQAAGDMETYIGYYTSYFATEGASDEDNRQATIQGLKDAGIDQDTLVEQRVKDYVSEQLHSFVTKDVAVTDEDIQAEYQTLIEEDKENYEDDDRSYNDARSSGETIAWNPEGYRAVKQVLIKFNDEQTTQYNELNETLTGLNDELAALDEAESGEEAPEEEAAEAEAAEEEAAEAEAAEEEPAEEEEPPRTREEIQTDIGAVGASIEALYSELMPRAQEVVDAFNNGTSIDELIAQYNEDPGMTREPTASIGYAVAADSTAWDPAFTEAAMSIAEPGQISEPARGKNGIYIVYYLNDITPGEVAFEDIQDGVESAALEAKISKTYNDQVAAWVEEAAPVYHLDRF